MVFKEFWDRERGNVVVLLLTIIVWVILKWFDVFYLEYWLGIEFAFVIYLISLYSIYFILLIIKAQTYHKKIKITQPVMYYLESSSDPPEEKDFYGYLDVKIPPKWKITDCSITLEKITPIYYGNRILIDEEKRKYLSKNIGPRYKLLHWKSPESYQDNKKLDFNMNSYNESFSIGKISTRNVLVPDFATATINSFEFDVSKLNPHAVHYTNYGLYEYSIKFHWKRDDKQMIPKHVDGYIYSQFENGIKKIIVGVGNYNNNDNIPKPILPREVKKDD